jgi:hypothetical protein
VCSGLTPWGQLPPTTKPWKFPSTQKRGRDSRLRGPPRIVTTKKMHEIFRHEEVAYAAECFIMETNDGKNKQYSLDVQRILHMHKKVFEPIPLGQPPDRGFEQNI